MVQMRSERLTTERHWNGSIPTLRDVYAARAVVRQYLAPTPLIESEALSAKLGFDVLIKCESLNPTGAFKVRGGIYYMSQLDPARRARGVVAASTGNHGQSIAYAARLFGVNAVVFMPENANPLKVASMRWLGAEVIERGADFDACLAEAATYAESTGAHFIHSANEPHLIAGVATHTLEIMEQEPTIDALFVPIGGGSGLCGACIAGKGINPDLQVYGVQAEGAPAAFESWKSRTLMTLDRAADTFAEGVATRTAYELPADIFWEQIDDFVLVSDGELRQSILTLLETTRVLAEGAGAAGLAGAHRLRDRLQGKRVAIIVSGGNLTRNALEQALAEEHAW